MIEIVNDTKSSMKAANEMRSAATVQIENENENCEVVTKMKE